MGVYIPEGYWRVVENFSSNSVAVIAASTFYNPIDAVRDINELIKNDASAMPNEPILNVGMSRADALNESLSLNEVKKIQRRGLWDHRAGSSSLSTQRRHFSSGEWKGSAI